MKIRSLIICSLLLFHGSLAFASDRGKEKDWRAEAEAGYILTSGNTKTQSLSAKLDISRQWPSWKQSIHAQGIYSSEKDSTTGKDTATAQKFYVSTRSNLKFDNKNSAFLLVTYDDDRFSGYKYQASGSAGYERIIIKNQSISLSGEIGPGYRYSKLKEENLNGEDVEDEAILRMGTVFTWHISKNATFTQDINVEAGEHSTITRAISALKTQINTNLAMKLTYTVKYTDTVPAGTKKTDTETAVTLVISF